MFWFHSKEKEKKPEQPESPKRAEPESKEDSEGEEQEQEGASGGGWGGWTSGWIDSGSASALLGKAMSSVNAAVEVAKTKVTYV